MGEWERYRRTGRRKWHSCLLEGMEEDSGTYWLVSFPSVPGEMTKQIILEVISKHERQKLVGSSQQGFTRGKLCLTTPIPFCNEMTCVVDKGRAGDVVFFDFNKAF